MSPGLWPRFPRTVIPHPPGQQPRVPQECSPKSPGTAARGSLGTAARCPCSRSVGSRSLGRGARLRHVHLLALLSAHPGARPASSQPSRLEGWHRSGSPDPQEGSHRDPPHAQGAAQPIPISTMAAGEDEEGPAFFQAFLQPAVGDV